MPRIQKLIVAALTHNVLLWFPFLAVLDNDAAPALVYLVFYSLLFCKQTSNLYFRKISCLLKGEELLKTSVLLASVKEVRNLFPLFLTCKAIPVTLVTLMAQWFISLKRHQCLWKMDLSYFFSFPARLTFDKVSTTVLKMFAGNKLCLNTLIVEPWNFHFLIILCSLCICLLKKSSQNFAWDAALLTAQLWKSEGHAMWKISVAIKLFYVWFRKAILARPRREDISSITSGIEQLWRAERTYFLFHNLKHMTRQKSSIVCSRGHTGVKKE